MKVLLSNNSCFRNISGKREREREREVQYKFNLRNFSTLERMLEYTKNYIHTYFQKCARTCTKPIKIMLENALGAKYKISALFVMPMR